MQTPGDFFAAGECALHLPLIEVEGIGPIALPLLPAQAAQLIAAAERAPYGRGADTLVDTSVRRSWQISADRVRIWGKHWPAMLDGIVERAAMGLGAGVGVEAELYKLLVYDEGSFFLEHRDAEKSPGMFGTLIVALPSLHAGGELVIRHHRREARLDLRCADVSEVAWAAFYADCVHEVLTIDSGCRLVLVYNLRRTGRGRLPRPPSYDNETDALERLLRRWCEEPVRPDEDRPLKLVYPLAHAYTPAELSFAALKGADAASATVLTTATGGAACDLYVALLRIEESGAAEHNGYSSTRWRGRYHDDVCDDQNDDEFRVAEVFDRSLTLSDERRPDGGVASLGTLPFSEGEVCPPDALIDMEPDEQHFHEATGNEGASFERSYQRAAMVLWPEAQRLRLIARAGFAASMPALDGMVRAWIDSGAEPGRAAWHEAHDLAVEMLACWPVQAARRVHDGPSAESVVLSQLVQLQDREHIESMLANVVAAGGYAVGDNAALVQALKLLPVPCIGSLLLAVVQGNADPTARCHAGRSGATTVAGRHVAPRTRRCRRGPRHASCIGPRGACGPVRVGRRGRDALAGLAQDLWHGCRHRSGLAPSRRADRAAEPAGLPEAAGGCSGPPARTVFTGLGAACRLAARGPHQLPLRALPGTGPLPAECRPGGLAHSRRARPIAVTSRTRSVSASTTLIAAPSARAARMCWCAPRTRRATSAG
ncbi:MAG: hypothetical protein ABI696_08905 [Rubrivivax sp.]